MKTVTILGAAGRAGEACAQAFLDRGWRVRGIARDVSSKGLLEGIEAVECDALNASLLADACMGSDVIVHALNPTYDKWDELVLRFGKNVLAAARASGAMVIVPGNVYNFGTSIGMGLDEQSPFAPDIPKAKMRVELEAMFQNADDVQTIVVRAGDFFGGKRGGSWLDLMILKELRKNKFTYPGPSDVPHAFAYMPDYGRVVAQIAEMRNQLSQFETLHFEGFTLTGAQMKEAAEQAVGRKLNSASVPWLIIKLIGIFNPILKGVVEMSYLWRVAHSLDGSKLNALIAHEPTPLVDAMRHAIADLKLDKETPA